jgi:iron complex transport system ATP-binding protein
MLVLHGRFPWLSYPRVYRTEDRALAQQAMERIGIIDNRKKQLARLSGGERQKAYLAMLLAQDTPVILLDEPTTYLDIACQLEFLEMLRLLKADGKAIVLVVHDINCALEYADRIAVMKDGRLLTWEAPETVLSSGAIEAAFGVKAHLGKRYVFCIRGTSENGITQI